MPIDHTAIDHTATDSIDQALAYRITRVARRLRTHLAQLLAPHNLGPEQFMLLFRLRERDGRSQGDLVDPALDDRANISRLVAALERQGLVLRKPDPEDGRVRRVHLTAAGRQRLDAVLSVALEARQQLFGDLTDDQLDTLDHTLRLLETRLDGA